MMKKAISFIMVLAMILSVSSVAMAANTITVNPGEDLRTAINSMSPGDKLIIKAGNYTLPNNGIELKDNVTIEGEGEVNVTTNFPAESSGLKRVKGANFIIDNINFINTAGTALPLSGYGTVKNCKFDGLNGLRWCYLTDGQTMKFENCEIYGDNFGLHFDGNGGTLEIISCTFEGKNAISSKITPVDIKDSTFKMAGSNGYLSLYQNATLTNCTFDPQVGIYLSKDDKTITLDNCKTSDGSDIANLVNTSGTVIYKYPPVSTPKPSTGNGISVTYNGGNSFSTSNPAVPTGVEIDGVPVTFNGTGSNFTVGCVDPGAKWVTVRWNSTSVTTNFTPDGLVECSVSIPKTGDMPVWAAVLALFGF